MIQEIKRQLSAAKLKGLSNQDLINMKRDIIEDLYKRYLPEELVFPEKYEYRLNLDDIDAFIRFLYDECRKIQTVEAFEAENEEYIQHVLSQQENTANVPDSEYMEKDYSHLYEKSADFYIK